MYYVDKEFNTTLEIKKSKFIAYITPYEKFPSLMQELKQDHSKGRHFVYAYRYLNKLNQIVENSSDDGEPKGTSGKPSLAVLSGAGLINTAVIIIRYFGGIKLGTGGLVKAYSDAVNLVISNSILNLFVKLEYRKIILSYSQLSKIEYIILKHEMIIDNKSFNDTVSLLLKSTKEKFELLEKELSHDLILEEIE